MFFVWGSKGFAENLGKTQLECTCPNCSNWVTMEGIKLGSKLTIFFIPVCTASAEYFIACPICFWKEQVSIPKLESYLIQKKG